MAQDATKRGLLIALGVAFAAIALVIAACKLPDNDD